jgi:hypothetical protein
MPKKVFLQPRDLVRHSRHHTAYAGDGPVEEHGKTQIYRLEFVNGIAHDVEEGTYQRFKALGIADVKPPKWQETELPPHDDEE